MHISGPTSYRSRDEIGGERGRESKRDDSKEREGREGSRESEGGRRKVGGGRRKVIEREEGGDKREKRGRRKGEERDMRKRMDRRGMELGRGGGMEGRRPCIL